MAAAGWGRGPTSVGVSSGSGGGGAPALARLDDVDDYCAKCHTNKLLSPAMKLLVSSCCHRICDTCVRTYFSTNGVCPVCRTPLKRSEFFTQTFEDVTVEKEVRVRKQTLRVFNKREEDFATTREYDDYLEMVEDIIYNLVNNIDVEATTARVEAYRAQNSDVISRNKALASLEAEAIQRLVEAERRATEDRDRADLVAFRAEQGDRQRQREVDLARLEASGDVGLSTAPLEARASAAGTSESKERVTSTAAFTYHLPNLGLSRAQRLLQQHGGAAADGAAADLAASFDPMEISGPALYDLGPLYRYHDPELAVYARDPSRSAGGERITEVYERLLRSAFEGLSAAPRVEIGPLAS